MIVEEKISKAVSFTNASLKNLYLSLLKEGKPIYMNAWGWSMFPFIKNGDRIKIEPIANSEIEVGDIVAVDMKNDTGPWFFVHRVVKISLSDKQRIYITKGDAAGSGHDKPVTINLIVGRVTEIIRGKIAINLKLSFWRRLNRIIANISFKQSQILNFLSRYLNLLIEWRLLLPKIMHRITKGSSAVYNTERLFLECMRGDLLDEGLILKATNFIKEGIDWQEFGNSAIKNGFTVLVYNSLKKVSSYAPVPQSVLDELKSYYLLILTKCHLQHRQAMEILGVFEREKITTVVLKGIFLSLRLYGDIVKRGLSCDFDILVHPKEARKAIALIQENGYYIDPIVNSKQCECSFSKENAIVIDLHWEINQMFSGIDRIEGFFREARPVRYDNIAYYELKEEELLLYLCFEAASNPPSANLKYLRDTVQLFNKYNHLLNWDSIVHKARNYRLIMSLYIALLRSKKLLALQISDNILRKIGPYWPKKILIQLFFNRESFFTGSESKILNNSLLSYFFLELMECRSLKDYFYVLKRVFSPRHELSGNRNCILGVIKRISNLFKTIVLQQ